MITIERLTEAIARGRLRGSLLDKQRPSWPGDFSKDQIRECRRDAIGYMASMIRPEAISEADKSEIQRAGLKVRS